jgi:hypothetical protein|tara:strand:- start:719 stop:1093 length:375 start_codon:yes stop_codon:yes gene_type:complete
MTDNFTLARAIHSLVPAAQFSVRDGEIQWHDKRARPSAAEIDAAVEKFEKSHTLLKSEFVRRMTNEEATAIRSSLSEAGDRVQMLYDSVEHIESHDALFDDIWSIVSGVVGADRANELMGVQNV